MPSNREGGPMDYTRVQCRNGRQVRGLFEDGGRIYGYVQGTQRSSWVAQNWLTPDGRRNPHMLTDWDLVSKPVEQSKNGG